MRKESIFEALEKDIMSLGIDEVEKDEMLEKVMNLKKNKVNIMITGATGCGKSSTINALFDTEVAKVGRNIHPETMDIEKYELENLILWDTPGLGDGKEADMRHTEKIIKKLTEKDEEGNYVIDLVLVILNGSIPELGTSYELINNVIIPNLGDREQNRILIAINQADMVLKGRHWNYEQNEPDEQLQLALEEKVLSEKQRIEEATGVEVEPICYSAGFKEEGGEERKPYNLLKLLYYIIETIPSKKRLICISKINRNRSAWEHNDNVSRYKINNNVPNYKEEIEKDVLDSIIEGVKEGTKESFRMLFNTWGEKAGEGVEKVFGAVKGFFRKFFR